MALSLLRSFMPKTITVVRLPSLKPDAIQSIYIIKRGFASAESESDKRSQATKGDGKRINGTETTAEKSSSSDQKSSNNNTANNSANNSATSNKTSQAAN